jgi:phage tail sheath protein FI
MPEYLAPGVYVEEVSFRPKSIEGVSTSTAGFVGPTRFGPTKGEPELLTSFGEFERIYGGIDQLLFQNEGIETDNFMAYAVRAFFDNGGSRLYVSRTFEPIDPNEEFSGRSSYIISSPTELTLRARAPGRAGDMSITFALRASSNLLTSTVAGPVLRGVKESDTVYIRTRNGATGTPINGFFVVSGEGSGMTFTPTGAAALPFSNLVPITHGVHLVTLSVRVRKLGRFEDEQAWDNLALDTGSRNSIWSIFLETPDTRNRYLTIPFALDSGITSGAELAEVLMSQVARDAFELSLVPNDEFVAMSSPGGTLERPSLSEMETVYTLANGNDGKLPTQNSYRGQEAARDPVNNIFIEASGLRAFEDLEDISIVAAPGYSYRYDNGSEGRWSGIVQELITHCQVRMRYRVALLDSPNDAAISEIRAFRGQFESTHAALYYPWVTALDPLDPDGRREIQLPGSGYVAGICARTDVNHGVFKAPANEVVLGAIGFEKLLNKAQQDVLNPEGINCFRFFEGRGYRLWGARTISFDPEWKYLSVRRYFAYLEHSIDRGTQWAVFENNNEALWNNIRRTVEDFLINEWRNGALLGTKPEQAFFVRCDRSTMTQNDLDNGRLIVLVGVAVVKPAEFVIFRIGQWTADASA